MPDKRVFLGGTCNDSKWREDLVEPYLSIDYFNPVVEDWTPECMAHEIYERENCDWVVYMLTPLMVGFYSIAEVVDDSNKRPGKTVFCLLHEDQHCSWTPKQLKSWKAVMDLLSKNGAWVFDNDVDGMLNVLNNQE